MHRIRRGEEGFEIDGLTLGLLIGAASAYYDQNKHRQPDMGIEEFMAFQILASTLKGVKEEINEQ